MNNTNLGPLDFNNYIKYRKHRVWNNVDFTTLKKNPDDVPARVLNKLNKGSHISEGLRSKVILMAWTCL